MTQNILWRTTQTQRSLYYYGPPVRRLPRHGHCGRAITVELSLPGQHFVWPIMNGSMEEGNNDPGHHSENHSSSPILVLRWILWFRPSRGREHGGRTASGRAALHGDPTVMNVSMEEDKNNPGDQSENHLSSLQYSCCVFRSQHTGMSVELPLQGQYFVGPVITDGRAEMVAIDWRGSSRSFRMAPVLLNWSNHLWLRLTVATTLWLSLHMWEQGLRPREISSGEPNSPS